MKKITFILLVCSLFANVTNNGATVTIDSDVNVSYHTPNGNYRGSLKYRGYITLKSILDLKN